MLNMYAFDGEPQSVDAIRIRGCGWALQTVVWLRGGCVQGWREEELRGGRRVRRGVGASWNDHRTAGFVGWDEEFWVGCLFVYLYWNLGEKPSHSFGVDIFNAIYLH